MLWKTTENSNVYHLLLLRIYYIFYGSYLFTVVYTYMQGDIVEGRSSRTRSHSTPLHSLVHNQHAHAYVRMYVGVTLEAKFSSGK